MTRSLVVRLEEVPQEGQADYGGKAVNLARLQRLGCPTPEALVIHAAACEAVQHNPLVRRAIRQAQRQDGYPEGCRSPCWEEVRLRMHQARLPPGLARQLHTAAAALWHEGAPPVAVRSSVATEDSPVASSAGIYRSILDVASEESLWDAVRGCWASLWTPRAVHYREQAGLGAGLPRMAIILQRMVVPDAAGVAFSRDTSSAEPTVRIDALRGSGEQVPSGSAQPAQYLVRRRPAAGSGLLVEAGDHHQSSRADRDGPGDADGPLTRSEAEDLAAHVVAVEGEFGSAQDVEWAREGEAWWFLQARPIASGGPTPHDQRRRPGADTRPDARAECLRSQADSTPNAQHPTPDTHCRHPWGENIWSNANVGEVLPRVVTPLTASMLTAGLPPAMLSHFRRMGYPARGDTPLMREFAGRLYLNLAAIQWIAWQGWGASAAETNAGMGGNQPEIPLPDHGRAGWRKRLEWASRAPRAAAAALWASWLAPTRFARAERLLPQLQAVDLRGGSDLDALDAIFAHRHILDGFFACFMIVSSTAYGTLHLLRKLLDRWLPGEGLGIARPLLAGHGEITSAEQGYALRRLAGVARSEPPAAAYFRALAADPEHAADDWRPALAGTQTLGGFDQYLARYGHRTVNEWELAEPRWSEDPGYLLRSVAAFLATSPPPGDGETPAEPVGGRDGAVPAGAKDRMRRLLQDRSRTSAGLRWRVLNILAAVYVRSARLREAGKSSAVRVTAASRAVWLELARRMVERRLLDDPDDLFYLDRAEITAVILGEMSGETLRALAAERREQAARWNMMRPPPVIIGDDLPVPPPDSLPLVSGSCSWQGLAVSGGRAEGRARVLLSPAEGHRLQTGEVLVAPSTDPAWSPLFLRASGLVMEIGGFLSHGSIVAREYGIPAVANIPEVTRAIEDGAWIAVDGDRGEVEVLAPAAGCQ
jgi:phosphohistidine swiveling domain-containing protein